MGWQLIDNTQRPLLLDEVMTPLSLSGRAHFAKVIDIFGNGTTKLLEVKV